MTEDRRRNRRFSVEIPVRLTWGGSAFSGRLRDICRDAALVEAKRSCPLDEEVSLAMQLPGTGGPLEVVGRVIRIAPGEENETAMAILFTGVTPAAATRIDFFVALQG